MGLVAVALERLHGGLAGERVDEAHVGHDQGHAAALEPADEVPGEELAVGGHLLLEILGAVLTHESHPRLGKLGQVLGGHVLGGGEHLHLSGAIRGTSDRPPPGALGEEGDLLAYAS